MNDASWAADRYDGIAGEDITTGVMYDEDGMEHCFDSTQDQASDLALKVGRDLGIFHRKGRTNIVDHVEVKVAVGYTPQGPEWPPANLRFDFDRDAGVGAAVLLVLDRYDDIRAWMTHGGGAQNDIALTHDSWSPKERQFPSWSLVDLPKLREAICQWAFNDNLPPSAVGWTPMPDEEIGWL